MLSSKTKMLYRKEIFDVVQIGAYTGITANYVGSAVGSNDYVLSNNPNSTFSIDSGSGQIFTAQTLNSDSDELYHWRFGI